MVSGGAGRRDPKQPRPRGDYADMVWRAAGNCLILLLDDRDDLTVNEWSGRPVRSIHRSHRWTGSGSSAGWRRPRRSPVTCQTAAARLGLLPREIQAILDGCAAFGEA